MTESATPKPFFNRRRVIVGAVVVLILAVLGFVLVSFDSDLMKGVEAKFIRFEKSADDGSIVAVVDLKNITGRYVELYWNNPAGRVASRFASGLTNNNPAWLDSPPQQGDQWFRCEAGSERSEKLWLPEDGSVGRIQIMSRRFNRVAHRLNEILPARLQGAFSTKFKRVWISCDQLIQCPKKLPDGTVEPPRLISAPGAKP